MTDKQNLSYEDENGNTVFTSQFFRNRGTCCKTNCLHCPFGTTLKNLGLQFEDVPSEDIEKVQQIIDGPKTEGSEVSGMLLTSAFGTKKKTKITEKNHSKFKYIYLKEHLCGVAYKGLTEVKDVFLLEHFNDQGIDKEIVSGYLFE